MSWVSSIATVKRPEAFQGIHVGFELSCGSLNSRWMVLQGQVKKWAAPAGLQMLAADILLLDVQEESGSARQKQLQPSIRYGQ